MNTMRAFRLFGGTLILAGLLFCPAVAEQSPVLDKPAQVQHQPLAELWVRTSAEYRALCHQTYNMATDQLWRWSDLFEVTEGDTKAYLPGSDRPVAIILDLDETVIDNSGFQAFTARTGASFNEQIWDAWVDFQAINRSAGAAVPGAPEFLAEAKKLGVTPIYITNRMVGQEQATIEVLKNLGICVENIEERLFHRLPSAEENQRAKDVIALLGIDPKSEEAKMLLNGEGKKEARRRLVQQNFDVVAYFGDVLGDFEPYLEEVETGKPAYTARKAEADKQSERWGRTWFHLPNPMYGPWAPGDTIPKDQIYQSLEDYGFEVYLKGRRVP